VIPLTLGRPSAMASQSLRATLRTLGADAPVILRNSTSIWLSVGFNSALGFAFWWIADRQFSASAVGLAAAAISAMTLLGTAAMLGQGTAVMGEARDRADPEDALLTTSLLAPFVLGTLAGVLFAAFGWLLLPGLRVVASGPGTLALFGLGVGVTAATVVLDQGLVGFLLGQLQFGRNAAFAIAKLLLILAFSLLGRDRGGLLIYALWLAGNVLSLAPLLVAALRRGKLNRRGLPRWKLLRVLGLSGLKHHALNLSLRAPGLALTLVVAATLSAAATAYFYTAWMIASFGFAASSALATTLYAVGSGPPGQMSHRVRFTVGLDLLAAVLFAAGLGVGAPLVLQFFGGAYANAAGTCLRILGLGLFPYVVKDHYATIERAKGRTLHAASLVAAGGAAEVAGAALGAHAAGLNGLAVGWEIALIAEALAMLPSVLQTLFPENRTCHSADS